MIAIELVVDQNDAFAGNQHSDVAAISFSLNALILVGTGLLLGAAGSGFTIRRFLQV